MPWPGSSHDTNWGRCTAASCQLLQTARCDGFMCRGCCTKFHAEWANHAHPYDFGGSGHNNLPAHYGGQDNKGKWDYDYSTPPREGKIEELADDYKRVFIPLSNFRANKDWLVDYVG